MKGPRQRIAMVTHGGAGNDHANKDGCMAAAQAGFKRLLGGEPALAAAVAGSCCPRR
jgi:isoaspartyl peptidase/L-asparaginase-like protein (Ntn-hydrolase superfamily)